MKQKRDYAGLISGLCAPFAGVAIYQVFIKGSTYWIPFLISMLVVMILPYLLKLFYRNRNKDAE